MSHAKHVGPTAVVIGLFLVVSSLTDAGAAEPSRQKAPMCRGKVATIVGDGIVKGTKRADVIVTGPGADTVKGRGGADRICTKGGGDTIVSGAGADIIVAGSGSDIILAGGGSDQMYGGSGIDGLLGMAGSDLFSGGPGVDLGAFLASKTGVRVDLGNGGATGEGTDFLTGVEALMGSRFDDVLRGNSATNYLFAGEGDGDVLDGRDGSDYALFTGATGPIQIDTQVGTFTGGGRASHIENVIGSDYDDEIWGDTGFNYLDGGDGDDTIDGLGGDDLCVGETISGCRELPAGTDAPPANAGVPPGSRAGSGRGRMNALANVPHAGPAGETPGSGDDATVSARLRDLTAHGAGTSPAGRPKRTAVSTQWGFTQCPMMERRARIGTHLLGRGYFASQSSLGFGGYTQPVYSPWFYMASDRWWVAYGGQWFGPFFKTSANYWEWTHEIPVANTVYGFFFSYETQQWYSLGSCNGEGIQIGF